MRNENISSDFDAFASKRSDGSVSCTTVAESTMLTSNDYVASRSTEFDGSETNDLLVSDESDGSETDELLDFDESDGFESNDSVVSSISVTNDISEFDDFVAFNGSDGAELPDSVAFDGSVSDESDDCVESGT